MSRGANRYNRAEVKKITKNTTFVMNWVRFVIERNPILVAIAINRTLNR